MPGRRTVCISWLGIITDTLALLSKSPLMALLRCWSAMATLCQLRAAGCYLQGFNFAVEGKVEPVSSLTTTVGGRALLPGCFSALHMPPLPLRKNAVVLLARFPSPVMPAATSAVVGPQPHERELVVHGRRRVDIFRRCRSYRSRASSRSERRSINLSKCS